MLALLLVRSGGTVTREEFATLLWGEEPPETAANVVYRHIGALRRLIEPGLPARASGRWITLEGGAYRLDAPSSDLRQFHAYTQAGRQATADGDQATACAQYLAALRTWTGRCAAGLDPGPELMPEFAALDHQRAAVACAAADVALARDDVRDLVPLIREVADHHSFDEALQARLLLVLAADGKQAEAVRAFEKVRAGLAEHLGVDPGPELLTAYDRVLHQHTAAASGRGGGSAARPAPPEPYVVPAVVPPGTRFFNGRRNELDRLSALLPDEASPAVVTVTVDGLPGVGKTSLVVHWAHLVADRFPDGQLFIDLQGFDTREALATERVLMCFLNALGVKQADVPASLGAQVNLYRTLMSRRRMLVILDNARDAEHVRPLLPAAPGCFVLVTSRNRLAGLIAQEGAHHIALNPPSVDEAQASLRVRLAASRDAGDLAALDEIIERCGRLPLAMAVVAARAAAFPEWRLSEIAAELRDSQTLDVLSGDEPRTDLRSVFSWSYRMLSERAARLFRLLALHPGPDFGLATVASLAGLPGEQARVLIAELTRTRLITEHRYKRYVFHELIRRYAIELCEAFDSPAERDEAEARVVDHLRQTAHAASRLLMPPVLDTPPPVRDGVTPGRPDDVAEAMAWFTAELEVLEATIDQARPELRAWSLAECLLPFYQRRGMYHSWETVAGMALRAARDGDDREGQARMHRMIAGAKNALGRRISAVNHLERALILFAELGRPIERAYVFSNLGWVRYSQGDIGRSKEHYEQAGAVFVAEGHEPGQAHALLGIGYCLVRTGELAEAVRVLRRASEIFDRLGDYNSGADCASVISDALDGQGRLDQAIQWRRRAQRLFHLARNEMEVADNGRALGDVYLRAGRSGEAALAWQEARRIFVALGSEEDVRTMDTRLDRIALPR